ncbi:YcaO-like family protein [Streptomyces sp. NPDC028722]|uniref:YcaO-like family protein n=1 Tax=Streptomyces sp. NPDC028722 TaxID=3155016 RepID=UPI0033C5FA66
MTGIALPGTVRTRRPEDTWDALTGEVGQLGITRVARLTDLDYLGIPVWTAVRPSARTLVTSQGKGATDTLAKISAVLESAELWHAEQPIPQAERATHSRLRPPYPMGALPVKVDHPGVADIELSWTTGLALVSDDDVMVPADLIHRAPHQRVPRPEVFVVTSNGLACGNGRGEAMLHGLLETVERDVLHRDHATGGKWRTLVDPASITDSYCADLVSKFVDAGMWLEITHVANPYRSPVFAAYIWAEDYPVVFAGSGCHTLPQVALSRALTEAAQSRLTCIAGTRDDLESNEPAFSVQPGKPDLADLPTVDWGQCVGLHPEPDPDVDRQLRLAAATVYAVTGYEPIAVTLHDSQAYAAVKIVSPGTEMRITRSIPRTRQRHG